ncbi:hypothetical protein PTKIN_Ptkin16aG0103000 [Pterospermum kingtungense]
MDPNFGEKNTPISSALRQQQHTAVLTSLGEMNPLTSSSLEQQHYKPEEFTDSGELDSLTSSLLGQQHCDPDKYINWEELKSLTSCSLGQQQSPTRYPNLGEMNSHSLIPNPMGEQDYAAAFTNVPDGQLLQCTNSAMVENQTTGHNRVQDSGSGLDLLQPNVSETDTPIAGPSLVKSDAAVRAKTYREKQKKRTEEMEVEVERLRREKEEVLRNFSVQMLEETKAEMERLRKEKEEVLRNFSVHVLEDIKVETERLRKEKEELSKNLSVQKQENVKMKRLLKENEDLHRNSVSNQSDRKLGLLNKRICQLKVNKNDELGRNFSFQIPGNMKVEMTRLFKETEKLKQNRNESQRKLQLVNTKMSEIKMTVSMCKTDIDSLNAKADSLFNSFQVNAGAEGRENWIKIPILNREFEFKDNALFVKIARQE